MAQEEYHKVRKFYSFDSHFISFSKKFKSDLSLRICYDLIMVRHGYGNFVV